jgi:hypothetical protein
MSNEDNDSMIGLYTLLIGVAYCIMGLALFTNTFIGFESIFIPADMFQGAMLAIVGAVFVKGFVDKGRGDVEWKAYLSVGSLLAGILFALYLFMMLSNGLGLVLGFEDWLEWTPIEQFQPGLWLFIIVLPGAYMASKMNRSY